MGTKMPSMKDMQKIGREVQEYIQEQRDRMEKIEKRLDEIVGNKVETT